MVHWSIRLREYFTIIPKCPEYIKMEFFLRGILFFANFNNYRIVSGFGEHKSSDFFSQIAFSGYVIVGKMIIYLSILFDLFNGPGSSCLQVKS